MGFRGHCNRGDKGRSGSSVPALSLGPNCACPEEGSSSSGRVVRTLRDDRSDWHSADSSMGGDLVDLGPLRSLPNILTVGEEVEAIAGGCSARTLGPDGSQGHWTGWECLFFLLGSTGSRSCTSSKAADATTQTTLAEDYVPIVEYLDRDVPVYRWHPGPIYVSPHGENFHTFSTCWGLRNVPKPRRLMFCNLCQNNQGRSLY